MANSDTIQWHLYDTDLTTRLGGDIPALSGHIYTELNQPGSGEIRLPLDSASAALIGYNKLIVCNYRGANRFAFFVDNKKQVDANQSENAGRELSISGRGALAMLENEVIVNSDATTSTRSFSGQTKAAILITLLNEVKALGGLSTLTWNFSSTVDTNSVAWTDSESYDLAVGTPLLDVARQFAETGGFDFDIQLSGGGFVLSAYSAGLGSNKTSTIYFRTGLNVQEAAIDGRAGKELINAYLVKYAGGFLWVSDSTSIAANGRHVGFLNIEQAQTAASATTYASAKLALNKNAKENKPVVLWDGNAPNVFLDYTLGDTVSLDRFGTVTSDRILGLQLEFSGDSYATVTIDFNVVFYDHDLKLQNQLDALEHRWATAHDANQIEVSFFAGINTSGRVNALHEYNSKIYVGGWFTAGVAPYLAAWDPTTATWSAVGSYPGGSVQKITHMGTNLYVMDAQNVYKWTGAAWSTIGTVAAGTLYAMYSDGTNIYVGGTTTLTSISGVALAGCTAKWNGSAWSDLGVTTDVLICWDFIVYGGVLYGAFQSNVATASSFQKYSAGWSNVSASVATQEVFALAQTSTLLVLAGTDYIYTWNGTTLTQIGQFGGSPMWGLALATSLEDIYVGGEYDTIDGAGAYGSLAKRSGGVWQSIGTGVSRAFGDGIRALLFSTQSDLHIGGVFTTLNSGHATHFGVYMTDFQNMTNYLSNSSSLFDLAAAIHNATAAAITDSGEMGFWDAVTSSLRKITWANIKATLKTYFDTLYAAITHATQHKSGGSDAIKLDELAAPTDVTTLNASTSAHGLVVKAVAPAANMLNVVGIANGETAFTNKSLFDATNPAALGTAAPGTSLISAHRDHVHAMPVASDVGAIPVDGWIVGTGTWSYSSADAPTFVISINADVTAIIGVGDRIKLTQTTAKYFIVTAVGSFSGGATLVTVYGGTDYTLVNAAISSPYYSHAKVPFGFPVSPAKWSVTATDSSDRTQTNPVNGTWYNLGSLSVSVPIGLWRASYIVIEYADRATAGEVTAFTTLSTANNSESNSTYTRNFYTDSVLKNTQPMHMDNVLISMSSKTTHYLNEKVNRTGHTTLIALGASSGVTTINLECAYL